MTDQIEKPTLHTYDVAISIQLPGQTRSNTYHLKVEASSIIDAILKGGSDWRKITEPRDVQVKEVDVIIA